MTGQILTADQARLRASRTSVKWRAHPEHVLPLWVAEMDAEPCAEVVHAVSDALRRGDTGYSWGEPLVEAFTGFARRRWGWEVEGARVLQTPDVMIGISELVHAHTSHTGTVVVSPPVYDSFYGFIEASGRRLLTAPLGDDLRLDPEALERAFAQAGAGSVYLLCNPQNPTGTVHTAAELAALAGLAEAHGVLVVSDEIHAPLVHAGATFTPYLGVPGAERGIALVSGSKAWNLAGLKTALAVPGPGAELGLHEVVTHGAQHLAVIAQTTAWNEGEPWLAQLHTELADRRRLLTDLLDDQLPEVRVAPAQATFLSWLDCRALGLDDPAAAFLEAGVALVAGTRYDTRADGWVRLNHATSTEVLTEAVARMAQVRRTA